MYAFVRECLYACRSNHTFSALQTCIGKHDLYLRFDLHIAFKCCEQKRGVRRK